MLVSRGCSSVATSPFLVGTGTISSAIHPPETARKARAWLSRLKASCSSRETS